MRPVLSNGETPPTTRTQICVYGHDAANLLIRNAWKTHHQASRQAWQIHTRKNGLAELL